MTPFTCFLITFCQNLDVQHTLLRVAIKLPTIEIPTDVLNYPNELNSHAFLKGYLPLHCVTLGPIVAVEQIFDVVDETNT